jgi:hypothetical protein
MTTKLEREEMNAVGRERFAAGLPTFVLRWRALGYDPTRTFLEEVKGYRGRHPRIVANACLDLVAEIFGVTFTGRTRSYDEEHGSRQRVGFGQSVPFYRSPAHVLAITLRKLQGRAVRTDDEFSPGLDDEILMQLRAVMAGPASP